MDVANMDSTTPKKKDTDEILSAINQPHTTITSLVERY